MGKAPKPAPLTDTQLQAPITRKNFFERGLHYIRSAHPGGDGVPTIAYNPLNPSPEWQQWREYFERHLGWTPYLMRQMIERAPDAPAAFTVPAQFPVTFDRRFRHDPNWKPAPPRLTTAREMHEKLAELQARYGPKWGIKDMGPRRPPATPWQPPTDAELRAKYGKRHDEP